MLYIRADMNQTIATGHMMRCLAIADAAGSLGEDTTFILADDQAAPLVTERGYTAIVPGTKWDSMDMELGAMQSLILSHKINLLLVDSYMVTEHYLRSLSRQTHVAYLDDLDTFRYPVQTLICYASYWKNHRYEERYGDANLLLGPQYTPLREAFRHCGKKEIRGQVEHLLLLSGGADHFHVLGRLLERIERKKYRQIDVICGKYCSDYGQLCGKYRDSGNIRFHQAASDIENYMMQADMAISAGGTTLYELCACGTPTVSWSFADNQLKNVLQFEKDRIIDYAGDVREADIFCNIRNFLERYHDNREERQQRSNRMRELVDGKGAERIAAELAGISRKIQNNTGE